MRLFFLLLCVLLAGRVHAQQVEFYGYVKSETIHDTRQVAQVREGQFALYPLRAADANADGHDDHAQRNLLMAAFQSRVGVKGSSDLGDKGAVTATLEADFFGQSNENVSTLRLRQAFVHWQKGKHAVLAGQTWSPFFTAGVHPGVVAFATGAPFQPFARFPQIRYTWTSPRWGALLAASTQRDAFSEIGGSKMQQQSGEPALHAHATAHVGDILLGVGGTSKRVLCYLDGPDFRASAWTAYGRKDGAKGTFLAKFVQGDDLTDHLMTGGFLADRDGSVLPMRVRSAWLDASRDVRPALKAGLFVGWLQNLGVAGGSAVDPVESFARASDLVALQRIAPRLVYTEGVVQVALELEWTRARFANAYAADRRPLQDASDEPVHNVRTLLAVYYTF